VRIYNYTRNSISHAGDGASFARSTKSSISLARSAHHQSGLLAQLAARDGELVRALDPDRAKNLDIAPVHLDEKSYRWMHNEDAMAVEKLSEASGCSTPTRATEAYAQAEWQGVGGWELIQSVT